MGQFRTKAAAGITSSPKIVANIFISFIGAGMLGLPYAFKESGILEGAIIMSAVGYLSTVAMLMLIDCKYAILASGGRTGGRAIVMEKKAPLLPPSSDDDTSDAENTFKSNNTDLTYGDVGLYALGTPGKRLVDVAVLVSQVGFCCGYLIYLCRNLSLYAPILSQYQWLLLLLPPLYCLTLLRHLNKLAVFSLFAQVSNVFALAVVFWFDFSHSESVPFVPKEVSIKGLPFFFAVAIYCYEGAGLILSLEESVAESKRQKFRSIFTTTMIGLTLLYISFGVSGYLSFGPHTEDIITLNLPHGDGVVDFAAIVKVCLGIALFFTYPMMLFPVSHMLDRSCQISSTASGNFVRLVVVLSSGLVVIIIPNFGILISLIGATCCTLLAFILPAVFYMKIFKSRMSRRTWYFNMLLISLGVLGTIVGLWDTCKRLSQDSVVTVDELSHSSSGLPNNISDVESILSSIEHAKTNGTNVTIEKPTHFIKGSSDLKNFKGDSVTANAKLSKDNTVTQQTSTSSSINTSGSKINLDLRNESFSKSNIKSNASLNNNNSSIVDKPANNESEGGLKEATNSSVAVESKPSPVLLSAPISKQSPAAAHQLVEPPLRNAFNGAQVDSNLSNLGDNKGFPLEEMEALDLTLDDLKRKKREQGSILRSKMRRRRRNVRSRYEDPSNAEER